MNPSLVYCVHNELFVYLFYAYTVFYIVSGFDKMTWYNLYANKGFPEKNLLKLFRGQEIPFSFFLTCLLYSCKGNVAFLIVLSVNFRLLSMWLPWQSRCLWWNCVNCNLVWSSLHFVFICVRINPLLVNVKDQLGVVCDKTSRFV